MIYLYKQIRHIRSPRYSALARERKHSAPAKMLSRHPRRQERRSPVSGGVRRGPLSTQEREKALEAVRAVTQPKVCITNSIANKTNKTKLTQ